MTISHEVHCARRALARRPAFSLALVTILGLTIGANVAVFSLLDSVLLHPIAAQRPDELAAVFQTGRTTPYGWLSFSTYLDFARRARSFSSLAAFLTTTLPLGDQQVSEDVTAAFVTDNYFATLGVHAAIGRTLQSSDSTVYGGNAAAVLSAALWRSRFGGDPAVLGRGVLLNGHRLTVIGVASADFRGTNLATIPDVWLPISMIPRLNVSLLSNAGTLNVDVPIFSVFGRLKATVLPAAASTELNAIDNRQSPDEAAPILTVGGTTVGPPRLTVVPLTQAAAAVRDRPSLLRFIDVLFATVGLMLLLACVNMANLLTIRASERRVELAVRTALGASPASLARQLFAESLMLAVAGGVLGLAVAGGMTRLFAAFALPGGLSVEQLRLGTTPRLLAFSMGVSLATAVFLGTAPALQARRPNVVNALSGCTRQQPVLRGRGSLLAVQLAASLMILTGAALFLRSLSAALATDFGFHPDRVAAVSVFPNLNANHAENVRSITAILSEASRVPGIGIVAAASHVPIAQTWLLSFNEGSATRSPSPSRRKVILGTAAVTADFFNVLGVPLLAGRFFSDQDVAGAPRVAIINQSGARSFWPGDRALGKEVNFKDARTYTIVGVVRDTKYMTLQDKAVPFLYAPIAQEDLRGYVSFLAKSNDPRGAAAALQRVAKAVTPTLRVVRPRVVSDQLLLLLAPQRFAATLLSALGAVALLISSVGVFGAVAFVVARRTTEIGVRVALGAQRSDVLRLVLWHSSLAVAVGVVAGLIGAALETRLIGQFLYEVGSFDVLAFGGAAGLIVTMAFAASVIPAVRALRVDPVNAIRSQ